MMHLGSAIDKYAQITVETISGHLWCCKGITMHPYLLTCVY